eukprot:m.276814 g.276814  ORF g.276814 m.276814 type:complete len:208 (+) comp17701_c0_seq7:1931-2554(+)
MLLRLLEQLNAKKIVLASGSPRRKEILESIGLKFEVVKSQFDEKSLDKAAYATPFEFVKDNALHKAREVAGREQNASIIIGCDTVVILDEKILEKPDDDAEAVAMLTSLSGRTHHVASGVALLHRSSSSQPWQESQFHQVTQVTFGELDPAEIKAYVTTGDSMDKAGSYGIQSIGGLYVSSIQGDYYNVVGLPLHECAKRLSQIGAE